MTALIVVIGCVAVFLLVKKLFGQTPESNAFSVSRSPKIASAAPSVRITAVDEDGLTVDVLDPRVTEVTEHPVFKAMAPMVASGDWGAARRFLQKIAYGISDASADEQRIFKKIMTIFAESDPMYQQCVKNIKPLIEENPGIKQTALYPHMAAAPDTENCRYVLYFAHELGDIVRRKKGNSYEVYLPGQVIPMSQTKAKQGVR